MKIIAAYTLAMLISLPTLAKKNQDTIYTHYLSRVKQDIRTAEQLLTDSIVQNHQYFFINESHGYKDNYVVALKLLKELKNKTDFTYIMAEADIVEARLLNEFMETGDTLLLQRYLNDCKETFSWCQERYQYYLDLYSLNQTYTKKLRFFGVDVAQSAVDNLKLITSIRSKYQLPIDFPPLPEHKHYLSAEGTDYAREILSSTNTSNFSEEDRFLHDYCLQNMINLITCIGAKNWDQTRDSLMFENYGKLMAQYHLEHEKMFGVFGRNHGYRVKEAFVDWYASRLSNADKAIYSIALFYVNGKRMVPEQFIPGVFKVFRSKKKLYHSLRITNDSHFFQAKDGISDFMEASDAHSLTYYNLNQPDSPFRQSDKLVFVAEDSGYVTTDCFQAAVLVRNSEATQPFGENRK
ncbi:hypothetical protein [Carboxylicivirga taeanensis]|uniref:hypothetical protein n=1 Tax=Carboxylicivirga taeanensis TaxID=1416875 RepID=UPI003F6E299F